MEDHPEKFLNSTIIYKMLLGIQHHQSVGGYQVMIEENVNVRNFESKNP